MATSETNFATSTHGIIICGNESFAVTVEVLKNVRAMVISANTEWVSFKTFEGEEVDLRCSTVEGFILNPVVPR